MKHILIAATLLVSQIQPALAQSAQPSIQQIQVENSQIDNVISQIAVAKRERTEIKVIAVAATLASSSIAIKAFLGRTFDNSPAAIRRFYGGTAAAWVTAGTGVYMLNLNDSQIADLENQLVTLRKQNNIRLQAINDAN